MAMLFISNSNFSFGLSGGDRIFLELIRRWSKKQPISLMGSTETQNLLTQHHLPKIPFFLISNKNKNTNPTSLNIVKLQVSRLFKSVYFILSHLSTVKKYSLIYSASDFYADFFPALLIKIIYPRTIWIVGYYLFAPTPTNSSSPYNQTKQPVKGFIYFLAQKVTLVLTRLFADYVFVTSDPDISKFICPRLPRKKIIVIRGGVDTTTSSQFLKTKQLLPLNQRKYTACFVGRFHPQKGILELIDIWKIVTLKLPQAKLAIVGDGQLKNQITQKIQFLNLSNNIDLLGFLDGRPKDNLFKNSCLVVHPAIYDSGGMAAAEAMVWGLPAISFDLKSLQTYYPQGMIKIPCYNLDKFANTIIKLIKNKRLYQQISRLSRELIITQWDWDNQAKTIYSQII